MDNTSFEASELGFPPGHWPETFRNGNRTFYLTAIMHRNGEVQYALYAHIGTGDTVTIFND